MELQIGSNITWRSAAGRLTGTIKNIVLSKNAAKDIVPWIDVETDRGSVRLCGTQMNLTMLSVTKG